MNKFIPIGLFAVVVACQPKSDQAENQTPDSTEAQFVSTEFADEPDENSTVITAKDYVIRQVEEIQTMELTSSDYILQTAIGNFDAGLYFDSSDKLRKMVVNEETADNKIYAGYFFGEEGKLIKLYVEKSNKNGGAPVKGNLFYSEYDQSLIDMELAVGEGDKVEYVTEYNEDTHETYLENVLFYFKADELAGSINNEFVLKENFLPAREDFFSVERGILENSVQPKAKKSDGIRTILEYENFRLLIKEGEIEDFVSVGNYQNNNENTLDMNISVRFIGV